MKIYLTLCIISAGSLVLVESQQDCITSTSRQPFDEQTELCCSFGVVKRYTVEGQEQECCANQTFIRDSQICCGESVLNRVSGDGRVTSCCGGIQFRLNDESKLCCKDKLYDIELGETSTCCGNSKIDPTRQECCRDYNGQSKIHNKLHNMRCCQENYYNKSSEYCFRGRYIMPLYLKICGNTRYDVRDGMCCGTTLYAGKSELDPSHACCGDRIFNNTEQKCCKKNLISAEKSCCHQGSYDEKSERCCEMGPVQFKKQSEQCCGAKLIDTMYEGCCGASAYNLSTYQCCVGSNTIIPMNSDLKCCGLRTYNTRTDVCCRDETTIKVIHKLEGHHDKCCSNDNSNSARSYSSSTHFCSMGMVISNRKKMCGARYVMDEDSDLCCQGRFYQDGKKMGQRCCGVRAKTRCNSKKRSRSNRRSRIRKRNLKGLHDYGICRICRKSQKYFIKALKFEDINICRRQALKVTVIDQQLDNSTMQKIYLEITKDLYSNENVDGEEIEVLLPCGCKLPTRKAILITDTKNFSWPLRLGDSDVLLPWTPKINRQLHRQRKKCLSLINNLGLNSMSDETDFVKIQIIKRKNPRRGNNFL